MKSSKNPRFVLSTFIAAMMVFAWTESSHADLWVASGTDGFGDNVLIDLNVTIPSPNVIQIQITNNSDLNADAMSDIGIGTKGSLQFASISVLAHGAPATWDASSPTPDTLMLTAETLDYAIYPGKTGTITITGATIDGNAPVESDIKTIVVSTGTGGNEIAASLVPEPSSMVVATFGALGFLGYSLRRRIAK